MVRGVESLIGDHVALDAERSPGRRLLDDIVQARSHGSLVVAFFLVRFEIGAAGSVARFQQATPAAARLDDCRVARHAGTADVSTPGRGQPNGFGVLAALGLSIG